MSSSVTGPVASSPGEGRSLTRDRILDVAETLFAENGLAGTAVRDIARAAHLTPASLYNHFAGKHDLYEAVIERGVRPLLEVLQALPPREHSAENIDDTIDAIMKHLAAHPHLARLIHHEVISGGDSLKGLVRDWIRPLVEQAQARVLRDLDDRWTEEELPLLISGWIHLVLGHFALAPMLEEIFGEDPLTPRSLDLQTRFLRKLSRVMRG